MKLNGLIYRIEDEIYLSLIDPKTEEISDGIPITEGVYDTLKTNQISYSEIIIQDGTIEIDDMNVYDFIDLYMNSDPGVIFLKIKDIMEFSFENFTIREILEKGDFEIVSKDIIKDMKKEKIKMN